MSLRAMIFIQLAGGVPALKQAESCMLLIERHALDLVGHLRVGSGPRDAAAAVRAGDADVIVAAFGTDIDLTDEIEAAGGKVEYATPRPTGRRLTVRNVITRLYRSGMSTTEIARRLETSTHDITDSLRRAGIRRHRK